MALHIKQLALIEAIIANPSATNLELAATVQINKNTVTTWRKKPEFKAALNERLREVWEESEAIAVDSMRNLAKNGNFQASKYILDSLGYAPAQKIEADIKTDIVIDIED